MFLLWMLVRQKGKWLKLKVFVLGVSFEWYIIIIWVAQCLKIPPPSTTRVNFQVCLVPLPESILESSTGLQSGSESASQEQLYGFPSDWFKMSQDLFCLWASTIPQLCLGGPVLVSALSLPSSLQLACDLHPTFWWTPSQVSNAKQGPGHAMCRMWSPIPSSQLADHCLMHEKKTKQHTCRSDHNSVCMHILQEAGQAEIE